VRRTIAIEVTQSWTACPLVQAGAGIAIMDSFTTLTGMPSGLVVRPFSQPRIRGRLLHAVDRPSSRHAQAFTEKLVAVVQNEVTAGRITA
jgi:DNA-binding transcriptional LysR family regulator